MGYRKVQGIVDEIRIFVQEGFQGIVNVVAENIRRLEKNEI